MTGRLHLSTRERVRLFQLHGGRCHICGAKIDGTREGWDVEHVIPAALIGRAAETDENRKPAHRKCHRRKTREDAARIAKAKRQEAKFTGAKAPSRRPLPCGRDSDFKMKIGTRQIVARD